MNLEPGEEFARKRNRGLGTELDQVMGNGLFRWRVQDFGDANSQDAQSSDVHVSTAQPHQKIGGTKSEVPKQQRAWANSTCIASSGPLTLGDVASVLRSKNAGPFEITFDVMFDTEAAYLLVKDSGVLNQPLIERLYNLKPEEVIWCGFFDQARAYKATIARKQQGRLKASGGFGETDVHGSQQYIPLFRSMFPGDVSEKLRKLL